ncbi:MAG: MFS transporter [Desulfobulbaceae bacterium]|nr:MFS transporter [Desulfobulbaceae bacterium]
MITTPLNSEELVPSGRPPGRWQVFFLVAVGIFMATLDGSIVNIAVTTIMKELNVSVGAVQWVVMIYLLTVTSLLLSFGRLSDIHGRRLVYSFGLVLFSVGSLLCGLAGNIGWLIGARLFQGLGAAMIMACTPALIVDTFPPAERGRALGLIGSVVASGLTTGPVLGGLLLHYFSWRAIFLINIPIGLVTAGLVYYILKGSQADSSRPETFDWPGAILLALCLGSLLLSVTHGHQWGYFSSPILLLAGLSLVSAAVLVLVERKTVHPILDGSLFSIRLFALPILAAIIIFAGLFSLVFLMPFYLINPAGFPVDKAGYMMATIFVFLFVISPISGALSDRIGSRLLCTMGSGIVALALYLLSLLSAGASVFDIIWRLALAGIGMAVFIPPNSATAMNNVPPHRRGVASGTVAAARNLGMVLGVALSGAVFNSTFYRLSGGEHLKIYRPDLEPMFMEAFHTAMTGAVVIVLVGVVISYLRGPEVQMMQAKVK